MILLCLVLLEKKFEGKKRRFKVNLLTLYVYANSFYLFLFIIYYTKTKKFKNMKNLRNFDYIGFSFYIFHSETKREKIIFLNIYIYILFLSIFCVSNIFKFLSPYVIERQIK